MTERRASYHRWWALQNTPLRLRLPYFPRPVYQDVAVSAFLELVIYAALRIVVAFVPEMPEEFLEEDDVRAFGSMTQEHYDAWRHIEASFPST
ncbi:hypothetical protein EDB83DRAFT_2530140 [Lactarius deliciosus]|nr:hypothetical protein EDB83DRAFT_2530140 [Lactarius deliciosus]